MNNEISFLFSLKPLFYYIYFFIYLIIKHHYSLKFYLRKKWDVTFVVLRGKISTTHYNENQFVKEIIHILKYI